MGWASIIAALVTGVIGAGLGAWFGYYQHRNLRRVERAEALAGLATALHGEASVIADLVDVDLDPDNLRDRHVVREKVSRVAQARTVYDASAGTIGLLPGALPETVVRFYGRVTAKTIAMLALIDDNPSFPDDEDAFARFTDHRDQLRIEVEALREDLRPHIRLEGGKRHG